MKFLISHKPSLIILLYILGLHSTFAQGSKPDSILILTYNICWQCMANTASGSASGLGAYCVYSDLPYQTTTCAERMGKYIETIPGNTGMIDFDFAGFQEASKWQSIYKLAPQTLGNMEYETSQSGYEMMVTFYNSEYT